MKKKTQIPVEDYVKLMRHIRIEKPETDGVLPKRGIWQVFFFKTGSSTVSKGLQIPG